MEIGKVIGNIWATKKDERLNGQKLLVVKILKNEHSKKEGIYVAADIIGAGTGELVLLTRGGAAQLSMNHEQVPVDLAVVGIVDSIELQDS